MGESLVSLQIVERKRASFRRKNWQPNPAKADGRRGSREAGESAARLIPAAAEQEGRKAQPGQ